jgi:flagellar biosynthesis protein FlhA
MDGASKCSARRRAMARLLILFINIISGFVIGVAQHDLSAAVRTATSCSRSGDALVAQIQRC